MKDLIFSGAAAVEIQGPCVLEFVSLDKSRAEFNIIGITDPKVRVFDFRPAVRRKMRSIIKTGKVEELADYFNKPARVTMLPEEAGQLTLRLEKTRAKKPRHMLWIAIGIGEEIPYYDYKKIEIQQMEDKNYALVSLYKRPRLTTQK